MRKQAQSRRKGFTLLEVLMVVAIIGLLAMFIVPNLFGAKDKAEVDLVQATVNKGLNGALDLYKAHLGSYPREEDGGLMALVEPPKDEESAKKWHGPYVDVKALKDSWGTEYVYEFPGKYNEQGYDLSSAGKDRQPGTDDDIVNWKKE